MTVFLDAQPVQYRTKLAQILAGEVIPMAVMLSLDFAKKPLRLSNRNTPFVDLESGFEWGAGGGLLIGLPQFAGGDDNLAPFREYQLGLPEEWIDAETWRADLVTVVKDVTDYRGRGAEFLGQIFDPDTGAPVGFPFAMDVGQMDRMSVSFQRGGAVLSLSVEGFMSRKGAPVYGMQTYFDQRRRFPTDEGLQFVTESERLVVWTNW